MGTQQDHLNETVLLSTQDICYKSWLRKYLQLKSVRNFSTFIIYHTCLSELSVCFFLLGAATTNEEVVTVDEEEVEAEGVAVETEGGNHCQLNHHTLHL